MIGLSRRVVRDDQHASDDKGIFVKLAKFIVVGLGAAPVFQEGGSMLPLS